MQSSTDPGAAPVTSLELTSSTDALRVERRGEFSARCEWRVCNIANVKQKALWSKYFAVAGYDCRLLLYPHGDSQALPGYMSVYLQVSDPSNGSAKWDLFASYSLAVDNSPSKAIRRDSWHRFSTRKKSHGWCDFALAKEVLDPANGYLRGDDLVIAATIMVLSETTEFTRDDTMAVGSAAGAQDVLSGKFVWRVRNFSLFREMIRTQKIMSPVFPAGACSLRLSVYQSTVNGQEYLSMCLESRETDRTQAEKTCWCLFRMSVLTHDTTQQPFHRDSYGRFAGDPRSGDNASLGWNDFMAMEDFTDPARSFLVDDVVSFGASFHVIKESTKFLVLAPIVPGRPSERKARLVTGTVSDAFQGKLIWRIDNFGKLKDILKKRRITGLCIKSRRFQVGGRDCRLIIYPRGQTQPPVHLSIFLEVTDPAPQNHDWSCFVSHKLAILGHKSAANGADTQAGSVVKESQNRYSKTAKDWGWREFVSLTQLFDAEAGLVANNAVVFSAEVQILKESWEVEEIDRKTYMSAEYRQDDADAPVVFPHGLEPSPSDVPVTRCHWRVDNFASFKHIMESRKIFSRFFHCRGCDLRVGVYESFDTLCVYIESDAGSAALPGGATQAAIAHPTEAPNFWVRYRVSLVNARDPTRTVWRESTICTRNWNNSVVQLVQVSEALDPRAGFLQKDGVEIVCDVLECMPWLEGADLEPYCSEEEPGDPFMPDYDGLAILGGPLGAAGASATQVPGHDSPPHSPEALVERLIWQAGVQAGQAGQGPLDVRALRGVLRDKVLGNHAAVATFLVGLQSYLRDPGKVQRLLLLGAGGLPMAAGVGPDGTPLPQGHALGQGQLHLMGLLMGVRVLQQAVADLLLDMFVDCSLGQGVAGKVARAIRALGTGAAGGRQDGSAGDGGAGAGDAPKAEGSDGAGAVKAGAESKTSADAKQEESPEGAGPGGEADVPDAGAARVGPAEAASGDGAGGAEEATSSPEDVLAVLGTILDASHALDRYSLQGGMLGMQGGAPRPPMMDKLPGILAACPEVLVPEALLLVPRLLPVSEHAQAAEHLRGLLAEAAGGERAGHVSRRRVSVAAAALGALQSLLLKEEDAALVMRHVAGLMPKLGLDVVYASTLVLRQAALFPALAVEAVGIVRGHLRRLAAEAASNAEARRTLASCQRVARFASGGNAGVAAAMLEAFDADATAACARATAGEAGQAHDTSGGAGEGGSAPAEEGAPGAPAAGRDAAPGNVLGEADIELLLEALKGEDLAERAAETAERCVEAGVLGEGTFLAVMERLAAEDAELAQRTGAAGVAGARGPAAPGGGRGERGEGAERGEGREEGTAPGGEVGLGGEGRELPPPPGDARRERVSLDIPGSLSFAEAAVALGMGHEESGGAQGQPTFKWSVAGPGARFNGLLRLADGLLASPSARVRRFAGSLFGALARIYAAEDLQLSVLKTLLLRSVGEAPMSDWGSPWASDEADEEGGAGQWANDAGAAQAEAEAGGPKPSRSPPGEAHPHPPPSSASGSQAAARGSLAESAPPEGAGRGTTAPPSPSRLRRGRSQGSLFLSKPELGEAAGGSVDGGDGADGGGGEPGAGEEGSCADTVGGSESGVAEESGGPEEVARQVLTRLAEGTPGMMAVVVALCCEQASSQRARHSQALRQLQEGLLAEQEAHTAIALRLESITARKKETEDRLAKETARAAALQAQLAASQKAHQRDVARESDRADQAERRAAAVEREREETVSRLQSQLREATTSAAERDRRAKAEQQGARDAQKRLQKDLKASEDRVRQAEGKARKAEEEAKRMRERNAELEAALAKERAAHEAEVSRVRDELSRALRERQAADAKCRDSVARAEAAERSRDDAEKRAAGAERRAEAALSEARRLGPHAQPPAPGPVSAWDPRVAPSFVPSKANAAAAAGAPLLAGLGTAGAGAGVGPASALASGTQRRAYADGAPASNFALAAGLAFPSSPARGPSATDRAASETEFLTNGPPRVSSALSGRMGSLLSSAAPSPFAAPSTPTKPPPPSFPFPNGQGAQAAVLASVDADGVGMASFGSLWSQGFGSDLGLALPNMDTGAGQDSKAEPTELDMSHIHHDGFNMLPLSLLGADTGIADGGSGAGQAGRGVAGGHLSGWFGT